MQLVGLAGNTVKSLVEFNSCVAQLLEDGVEECPLQFRDNRKNKANQVVRRGKGGEGG
jgi:hypothetical protein